MNEEFVDSISKLERRASVAKVFIVLVGASAFASAIGVLGVTQGALVEQSYYFDDLHLVDLIVIFHSVLLLVSFVIVGMWIHGAHKNLHQAGLPGLEYTPGWSIGWYAIPFANLFKPFQAMRELWNASFGAIGSYEQSAPLLLWFWWIGWLLASLMSFGETYEIIDALGYFFEGVSAIGIYIIVEKITSAQPSMSLASTFE